MPEIKVDQGRICDNGLGFPKKLEGPEAELQRIYNRLNVVRGSFRYDRTWAAASRRCRPGCRPQSVPRCVTHRKPCCPARRSR